MMDRSEWNDSIEDDQDIANIATCLKIEITNTITCYIDRIADLEGKAL